MQARRKWKALGATGASSLVLLAMAGLGTGAQAAGTVHKCGNHKITVQLENATPFKVTVKNVTSSGVSCSSAFTFLKLFYNNTTGGTPQHYKCTGGHFKVPAGSVPEVCSRKGAKIQFAGQGG